MEIMTKTKIFSAAALAGSLLFGGCSEDGDTIFITNPATATPPIGTLPATPSTTYNFANDGLAFSNIQGGLTYDGTGTPDGIRLDTSGLRCFWNNGRAIVMFCTEGDLGNGAEHYWAAYFNGSTFTPPVPIVAADLDFNDGGDVFDDVRVAWFNTAGFVGATGAATNAGRARNGDAIILWRQRDEDNAQNDNDEANENLYMTYFDVSASGAKSTNYGFDALATQVNDGSDTTANTGSDDVTNTFGVISDGLIGQATFDAGNDSVRFGDAVSFMVIAYVQNVEATASGGGNISDPRLLTKVVNIGATTDTAANRGPLLGTETRINPPTTNAETVGATNGNEETSVNQIINVYNNEIFYTVTDNDATATQNDTPLLWNRFDATTGTFLSASLRVNGTDDDPSDNFASGLAQMGEIFGSDEGLVSTFSCFSAGGAGGTDDTDVFMLQTPPVGAAFGAQDLVEVDNQLDATGNDDTATLQGAVINRDGTAILVAFQQDDTSTVTTDNVTVQFASLFQTARSGARVDMNNAGGVPFTATPTKLTNLATGDALIDLQANEEGGYRGIQSNRLIWSGWALINPNSINEEALLHWNATVTLGTATPTPLLVSNGGVAIPSATFDTAATTGNERIGVDPENGDRQIISYDDGSGGSLVVWVQETATALGNGADYYEAKISDGTTTTDLMPADDENQETFIEGGVTLPKNSNIAASPSWGGSTLHLFVNVPAIGGGANTESWWAVRHRSFNKNSTAATLGAKFSPVLSSPGTLLSDTNVFEDAMLSGLGGNAVGITAEKRHWVWNGSSLGVFFAHSDAGDMDSSGTDTTVNGTGVFYTEWNNGTWSQPTLVRDYLISTHLHGFDVCPGGVSMENTRTNAIVSWATCHGTYNSGDQQRLMMRLMR
jgi:hypothetical protein